MEAAFNEGVPEDMLIGGVCWGTSKVLFNVGAVIFDVEGGTLNIEIVTSKVIVFISDVKGVTFEGGVVTLDVEMFQRFVGKVFPGIENMLTWDISP